MIAVVCSSVLLVDDDPDFRGLARRLLTAAGLGVVAEAGTGGGGAGGGARLSRPPPAAAATAAALDLRPDAALVDVGLPDGDGISLAGALTAMPWPLRVVLTSSDADAATPDDVLRSGAHSFVPKADLPNVPLLQLLTND